MSKFSSLIETFFFELPSCKSHFIPVMTPLSNSSPQGDANSPPPAIEWFKLHIKQVHPSAPTPSSGLAHPVVAVHGLTRNHRDFLPLAAHLGQLGATTYCVDVPGRGESDRLRDPRHYNYSTYCAALSSAVGFLGPAQVNWVGTSMGGILGMMLAAGEASPIRALVLNDIGPFVPAAAVGRLIAYVGREPPRATLGEMEQHLREIYRPYGALSDDHWRFLTAASVDHDPEQQLYVRSYDPAIAALFSAAPADVDLFAFWRRIRCPVLVLRGAESDILSEETLEKMHQFRHPEASPIQILTIPDVGHAPSLFEPEQMQAISLFLSKEY